MNRALLLLLGAAVVAVLAGVLVFRAQRSGPAPSPSEGAAAVTASPGASASAAAGSAVTFGTEAKSAHFEGSTPAHGATLPAPPVNVVIDVNFDLAPPSSISVVGNGKEVGTGATTIDANKLALRRAVDQGAPDGLYTVAYRACWPDGSCHDGQFQFAIDRTQQPSLLDRRGERSVEVRLKDIAFSPVSLRVSRGTTITWVNDDAVEHYVNTDSHPAHTYYQAQNSKVLKTGDTYRVTFATPGVYPYHCSAHADTMRGMILVE